MWFERAIDCLEDETIEDRLDNLVQSNLFIHESFSCCLILRGLGGRIENHSDFDLTARVLHLNEPNRDIGLPANVSLEATGDAARFAIGSVGVRGENFYQVGWPRRISSKLLGGIEMLSVWEVE